MRRDWVAGAVLLATVAGCTGGPTRVSGPAGPLAAPAGAPASRAAVPPAPSGTATVPTAYGPVTLSRSGVTITLPVPADWSLLPKPNGEDYGDPSGRVLLRLEIREREGSARDLDAARAWEVAEPDNSRKLADYRRIGITPVTGPGDSAADWTFTFTRDGVRRQVLDRAISVGAVTVAIYFSAEQALYEAMLPVFQRAVAGLAIRSG